MLGLWDKTRIVAHYAQGAWAWLRHDTRYPSPVPDNPLFRSAADAAALVPNGAVVGVSGLGGHQRASLLYWAIRERFEQCRRPRALTIVNVGGHGGRGVLPGTLEELGQKGLCTRFITGHFETYHAMLALAAQGDCELQCLPLGVMTALFHALGQGRDSLVSGVGIGTFLDPRVGRGTVVGRGPSLVEVANGRLRYRLPRIDVAIFNLPAADADGNLYADGAATLCENRELALAAKRQGGIVLANVGRIRPGQSDQVFLRSRFVDAIVFHPDTEQTLGIPHRHPWQALTPANDPRGTEGKTSRRAPRADRRRMELLAEGLERARFVNDAAGRLTGRLRQRGDADRVLARVATATLLSVTSKGARVAIGTGLPESLPEIAFETGRSKKLQFLVESGVVGGVPLSGLFFGASLYPEEVISSAELFRRCRQRLDAACLGALEIDSFGNVNVSKRDHGWLDYVGPGGFIDFCDAADTIVFVCGWMRGGRVSFDGERMHFAELGAPKVVSRIGEITFPARRALRQGKRVLYVTHAGIFELGPRGLLLRRVMPGVDIEKHILGFSPAILHLPRSGKVPVVEPALLRGQAVRRL